MTSAVLREDPDKPGPEPAYGALLFAPRPRCRDNRRRCTEIKGRLNLHTSGKVLRFLGEIGGGDRTAEIDECSREKRKRGCYELFQRHVPSPIRRLTDLALSREARSMSSQRSVALVARQLVRISAIVNT